MGFFRRLRDKGAQWALNLVAEKIVNPNLEGIGVVKEIIYKNKAIGLTVELAGLEDKPIRLNASDIAFSGDNSSVTVNKIESNMPFMQAAMARFVVGKPIDIPEDLRGKVGMAKTILGL